MRKKIFVMIMGLMAAFTTANAQYLNDSQNVFSEGKWMIGASASGLDLNYHGNTKWSLDLQAKGGYLFADDLMITANLGYQNSTYGMSTFKLGAGVRYYFEDNGLYLGAGANFFHAAQIDDLKPEIHAGYAYFLSGHATIEPEIYYEQSFKNSDYTGIGFRLGFAYYF